MSKSSRSVADRRAASPGGEKRPRELGRCHAGCPTASLSPHHPVQRSNIGRGGGGNATLFPMWETGQARAGGRSNYGAQRERATPVGRTRAGLATRPAAQGAPPCALRVAVRTGRPRARGPALHELVESRDQQQQHHAAKESIARHDHGQPADEKHEAAELTHCAASRSLRRRRGASRARAPRRTCSARR